MQMVQTLIRHSFDSQNADGSKSRATFQDLTSRGEGNGPNDYTQKTEQREVEAAEESNDGFGVCLNSDIEDHVPKMSEKTAQ